LPASTSAAVINWLSGSTAIAASCPSKRRLALATVAHPRVVHGHNTIRADSLLETSPVLSALDVLHQQPGKQPSCLMQPLAQWLACGKLLHRLSDHHQLAIRIRNHTFQKHLPGFGIVPVKVRRSLKRLMLLCLSRC